MYYRMLFDFHQKQNAKKPTSIHATYLVAGRKRNSEQTNGANGRDGGDVDMRSSPFMSSMPEPEEPKEPLKETTILLVREEELKSTSWRIRCESGCADCGTETRTEFEEVTSIHVYSLEPGPIEVRDGYRAVANMAAKQNRIWACSRHAIMRR